MSFLGLETQTNDATRSSRSYSYITFRDGIITTLIVLTLFLLYQRHCACLKCQMIIEKFEMDLECTQRANHYLAQIMKLKTAAEALLRETVDATKQELNILRKQLRERDQDIQQLHLHLARLKLELENVRESESSLREAIEITTKSNYRLREELEACEMKLEETEAAAKLCQFYATDGDTVLLKQDNVSLSSTGTMSSVSSVASANSERLKSAKEKCKKLVRKFLSSR